MRRQQGFTLIELLVVLLVIGILAAIALPSFLGQASKADAAQAQELARSAASAMEIYATAHDGSYEREGGGSLTLVDLHEVEPAISSTGSPAQTHINAIVSTADSYRITVLAEPSHATFTIERGPGGAMSYPCTPHHSISDGCPNGTWVSG